MHAAYRIHHRSVPLPQASELCFQRIPVLTPPVVQSKGSRALLEGAASLEGSPVGRLTCTEAGVCGSIILCDNEIGDPPASFSRQVE